jgi:type I restriction enzyme, S subunit
MIEENKIPKNWLIKNIGEVCKVVTGTTPSKNNKEFYGTDFPFYKPTDLEQGVNTITSRDGLTVLGLKKGRSLPKKSILVTCIGATIGKTGLIKKEGSCNQQINAVLPNVMFYPTFLYYQIISKDFQQQIVSNAASTTLPILNKSKFEKLKIVIPPLKEQQAIVFKIEELLSDLENGKQQLQIAQQQLKIYRQSLLKWAFEGKLTNKNVKDGELPKGWKWVKLGAVANKITDGEHITPRRTSAGYLLLSARNIQNGYLSLNDVDHIPTDEYDRIIKRCNPEHGDILISCSGSIGRICRVPSNLKFTMVRSVALVKFDWVKYSSKFYEYLFQSPLLQRQIEKSKKATAQANLFLGPIKNLDIIICPLSEQQLIVDEIESKLTVCDKIEETISQSLLQAESLRQSILKKAFEGKLVK